MFEKHAYHEEESIKELTRSVQDLRDEINTYKTVIRVIKAIGATAILVLTLKFGDIEELWKK